MSCHLKTILLLETKVIIDGGQGFNLKGDYPMTIPANFESERNSISGNIKTK
jgi:hypothetical protein